MGSFSDYLENKFVDHILGTAYTAPTVYLALCTATVTDSDTGSTITETSYTAYTRQTISFGAASSRRVTQDANVTFPQAGDAGGTVTDWALVDAASSGNLLAYGTFSANKDIVDGSTPSVASGEIWVEFSAGAVSDYAAEAFLDLAFNGTAFTAPSTYAFLATATVSDDDTGSTITEPGSGAYARVQVNENGGSSPAWDLASGGVADNGAAITFPTATGSWGTVVAAGLADASSGGNLLVYDNAVTDQAVGTDDVVEFPAGDFDISCS